jgi:magnesium-transporting ATPase (P-type)
MNEMLLRGCTLKNTGHILGLAVYTGNETRIQKNSAKTPNKIGKSSLAISLKEAEHACFASKWYAMPAQLASRNVGWGICDGSQEFAQRCWEVAVLSVSYTSEQLGFWVLARPVTGILTVSFMGAGSYDRFLNLQIGLIIGMQLLMCLFCSVASLIWRERSGKERYYLGMTEYVQVSVSLLHVPVIGSISLGWLVGVTFVWAASSSMPE